jgi:hypothetical protein
MAAARLPRVFASFLLLPVALASALPAFQWCSLDWADIRPECFVACADRVRYAPSGACAATLDSERCESSCSIAPAAEAREPGNPCAPPAAANEPQEARGAEQDTAPSGDSRRGRAWCPDDHGGPGRIEPAPVLPDPLAFPVAAAAIEPCPDRTGVRVDRGDLPAPRSAAPGTRPPARAPPRA